MWYPVSMLIGAMNHPDSDVVAEIEWMAAMRLDFVDLTMEPPRAASWQLDPQRVRAALDEHRLPVVGHTAYYLPIASPFEELRKAAIEECRRCLVAFAALGASWMNVHADSHSPFQTKEFFIDRNLKSLEELLVYGKQLGIGIMVENIPGNDFNSAEDLGALLNGLPELGLHLDLGHCNLSPIRRNAERILEAHANRLRHVHLHDNKGGQDDLHLPLGAGKIDMRRTVRALKSSGYDGTITLEVFSSEKRYVEHSRDLLRSLWDAGK